MVREFTINTEREAFENITAQVREAVVASGVREGTCVVFCPHTTAGITINENADPDVVRDMLLGLREAFPDRTVFRHSEGNSSAHLRASFVGAGATVIISNNELLLGAWQGIYLCEFDGPRTRRFLVKVING